ncbi:MAG: amidohydrolase/deacetylase family metallohydrolase [Candidatus Rokuibacteriota bacterium]|nr:MAG: amidohydrolase/deacetylase family metallohydrolase [Candidatus Rokubacteria bacterium]
MYDLLLKGGVVIDPAQDMRGAFDVAVQDGRIARVAASIPPSEARRVIHVPGKTVTAGLIDLHTHVFDGVAANGVHPDLAGVHAGVTTVVDAGSAGCATFSAFPRHILPKCETEVIPLLHICQTGLATNPDIIAESSIDLESTLRVAREHKGLIKGIKARMVSPALEIFGMEMPRLAKRAARESGVPLMVHIGDTTKRYDPNVIRELLPLLEPGDIVTHLFTANPGGVLDTNGKLVPEAKELAARGVWLDTAHGRMNFGFNVGRRVLDQGLTPHCISTDLTIPGRANTVHSMVEIMARFLGMGFTLEQVIAMSTANPARAIGEANRLGSLAVGRQADISVLEVRDGRWVVYDTLRDSMKIDKTVVPVLTVKRGRVFEPEWGPHPWGWEPERVG